MQFKFEVELVEKEREYVKGAYIEKTGTSPPWISYPKHHESDWKKMAERIEFLNGSGSVWMNK